MSYTAAISLNKESFTYIPDGQGRKIYNLVVPVSNWDTEIPEEVNPRSHDSETFLNGNLPSKVFNSLKTKPDVFKFKNRGIAILAEKVTFDGNIAKIYITDFKKHGIADGGSTNAVIRKAKLNNEESIISEIQVKIYTGIEDENEIREICGGLNTSSQVKEWSLENAAGSYQNIKKIIDMGPYANKIGFEENDIKDLDIIDVLGFLQVFHNSYRYGKNHPTTVYSARQNVEKRFRKRKDDISVGYDLIIPKTNEFIELYLYIIEALNSKSVTKIRKKYSTDISKTKNILPEERKKLLSATKDRNCKMPISEEIIDFFPPKSFIIPIYAALRPLLEDVEIDGVKSVRWKIDPKKFIDIHKDELFGILFKSFKSDYHGSFTRLGGSVSIFDSLFKSAENKVKDEENKQLRKERDSLLRKQIERDI